MNYQDLKRWDGTGRGGRVIKVRFANNMDSQDSEAMILSGVGM